MRRSRKKKWTIGFASLLLLAWVPAHGWARYREVGWPGLIPTTPLVMSTMFIPDEPGSVSMLHTKPSPTGQARFSPIARLQKEIISRLKDTTASGSLDIRLLFMIARREPDSVLTDPTSLRGTIYRTVISEWYQDDRLTLEQEHWANGVNHFEISCDHAIVWNSEDAFADLRLRRLLHRTTIRVFVGQEMYEYFYGAKDKGFADPRRVSSNRVRWGVNGKVLIPCYQHTKPKADGLVDVAVRLEVFGGDRMSDVWTPIANEMETLTVRLAQIERSSQPVDIPLPTISANQPLKPVVSIEKIDVIDDPDRYTAWLAEACRVSLQWNEGDPVSAMPDRFSLYFDSDYMDKNPIEAFTFGGTPTLVVHYGKLDPERVPRAWDVLHTGSAAWWSIRDKKTEYGSRLVEHDGNSIGFLLHNFQSRWAKRFTGADVTGAEIIINFGGPPRSVGDYGAMSDPELKKLLTYPVRIPITGHAFRRIQAMLDERFERLGPW